MRGHTRGQQKNAETARGRRGLRTAGAGLGWIAALTALGGCWAYQHLNGNINGVDIDGALGTARPPRAAATPGTDTSPPPGLISISTPTADPGSTAAPPSGGAMNILVLGSDSRTGADNQRLGGGRSGGARSDTAMVVHVDEGHTSATVVSIPRDTLVTRPSCPLKDGGETAVTQDAMFNSAYAVGGPVCAVKTAEQLTGVRMDHYLEIDFTGFARMVDALGGVTVTTDQAIDDNYSHLHLPAGEHHLGGEQALALARTRHGIGDGSDLGRIQLQQQLVRALLQRIADDDLLTDPARLYQVADAVTGSLTADTGLDSLGELTDFGSDLRGLSADAVRTVTMPVVRAPSDPNRVVPEEPAASALWASLR